MSTGIENPISPIEAARDIIARVQALQEAIAGPDATTLTSAERRRIGVTAAVRERGFQSVLTALESAPHLGVAAQVTAAELRALLQYVQEFTGVVEELTRLLNVAAHHVASQKAVAARLARRVYRLARNFNTPADRELVFPHVEAMKKALGRPGRGKPKTPPDAAPPPPEAVKREAEATAAADFKAGKDL
jgi:hypothetical protein